MEEIFIVYPKLKRDADGKITEIVLAQEERQNLICREISQRKFTPAPAFTNVSAHVKTSRRHDGYMTV